MASNVLIKKMSKFDNIQEEYGGMIQEEKELLKLFKEWATFHDSSKRDGLHAEHDLQILKEKASVSVLATNLRTGEASTESSKSNKFNSKMTKTRSPKIWW